MALHRYATDPLELDIPPFVQHGTRANRRARVMGFTHTQAAQVFTLSLLLIPFSVLEDGSYGPELTGGIFQRQPDQLQATMLRLVDASGRILAERYQGHTATDAAWNAYLAQVAADPELEVYYQYELFRQWCDNPIVINELLRGFILQAYAQP